MRAVSKRVYVGAAAVGLVGGMVTALVGLGILALGRTAVGAWTLGIGLVLVAPGKAVAGLFIRRMWRAIADGDVRATPGEVLRRLCIPFYNGYWFFHALVGYTTDFNRYAKVHRKGNISLSRQLPLVVCILSVGIGVLTIAALVLLGVAWAGGHAISTEAFVTGRASLPVRAGIVLLGVSVPAWVLVSVLLVAYFAHVCDAINAFAHEQTSRERPGLPHTLIEAEHLTKYYGTWLALDDVSFSVNRGEVVGFLGPNGAGKTTTMRILTGYMPATDGTARVAGFDVHTQSLDVRRHVGYMPEGLAFYTEMRVREYLKYRARIKGVPAWMRPAAVAGCMERCSASDVAWKLIGSLSKGYRQRVGMADALLGDPPILVLDEPTIGLDPNQIRHVRDLVGELGENHTVLLSTHILREVEAVCTRVLIVHRGRLVFSGLPSGEALGGAGEAYALEVCGPQGEVLMALNGLADIAQAVDEGAGRFTVVARQGRDPREAIFRALAGRDWPILEMRPQRASLEEVFVRLTTAEGVAV